MHATAIDDPILRLSGLGRRYGQTDVVKDIDLAIPRGSFTSILGPSGCGKSTLLRMIGGLTLPTSGRIEIDGEDVTYLPPQKRPTNTVFQSHGLFAHMSVRENVAFGLSLARRPRSEIDDRVSDALKLVRLDGFENRPVDRLSGGQQQRVALGRAIIGEKPVCLMDEPLSNLDAKLRHEMRVELRALQQRLGFTMVYVTHDQVEAITMADQVVLLNGGRVEQAATPRDLYERPATPFAARFIGTPPMNLIPMSAIEPLQDMPTGLLLGVRPEALCLAADGGLTGTVRSVEYLGADTLADCDVSGSVFQVRLPGSRSVATGEALRFTASTADLHVFDQLSGGRRDDLIPEIGSRLRSQ
ncbi:MAG: ABC transporter ATP-binding protein [Nitratireductor sp.]